MTRAMSEDSQPVRQDELDNLFGPFADHTDPACALAVSGGIDSTALMVLFADWLRQRRADAAAHTVLTVDHGLRPESAAEARAVAGQASALGFRHTVLTWGGPKPKTGIQAAAREARYQLIFDYMTAHDIPTLLTAHTRDDQAETLLMRLARGSGVDGLAGMAPCNEAGSHPGGGALRIVRPLLGVAKARLQRMEHTFSAAREIATHFAEVVAQRFQLVDRRALPRPTAFPMRRRRHLSEPSVQLPRAGRGSGRPLRLRGLTTGPTPTPHVRCPSAMR